MFCLSPVRVFSLSLRLRQREMQTIFKLGCQKLTVARLLGAEILIIAMSSAVICSILVFTVQFFANDLARSLVVR